MHQRRRSISVHIAMHCTMAAERINLKKPPKAIDMGKQTRSFDETRRDWSWGFHRENMRLDLEEGRRKHGIAREKDRLRRRKTGWRCRKDRQRLQAGGRSRQGKEHAADAQRSLQEEEEKCWLLRQWHSYRVTA